MNKQPIPLQLHPVGDEMQAETIKRRDDLVELGLG